MTEKMKTPSSNAASSSEADHLSRLAELEAGTQSEAVLAFFDSLPVASVETLFGSWRGAGIPTGHPFDGMLEDFGWHGKRFESAEGAHPLVFEKANGSLFSINPSLIPLKPVLRYANVIKRPTVIKLVRSLIGLAKTSVPQARLRMTEFRGRVTATMIYDSLPINDVFRMVNPDTLLGVMDIRYIAAPFVFVLRREK